MPSAFQLALSDAPALRGHIFGLTLSNNASDATNDIDIAAGACASDATAPVIMALTSTLTKRLDANWAVGSGNGGLDTGAIANTTYHVWLIQRSDTGVVDALFSTSATSPTMPSGYDRKRRIGSIIRASAAIRTFLQHGDMFLYRAASIADYASTASRAAALLTISVPTGIRVYPIIEHTVYMGGGAGNIQMLVGPGDGASSSILNLSQPLAAAEHEKNSNALWFAPTNTNAQIFMAIVINSGSLTSANINTWGWIDTRGKDA